MARPLTPMPLDVAALEACADDAARTVDGFSGVACVARGADVVFARAAGARIRGEPLPNTIDTRFALASGCKLFTALAIARLVEAGRVALDARLRDVVPGLAAELSWLDAAITVEQLLRHTAGIRSYFEEDVDPDFAALWRDLPVYRVRRPRDFLPLFAGKSMKRTPGERFEYNDGGYILAGLVVEAVTGAPFADHVAAEVLAPAGMVDSGYFDAERLPPRTARAYVREPDGGWRSNVFSVPARGGPDGGAYATVVDLARLWHALAGGAVVSPAMLARVVAPAIPTGLDAPHDHYGLGVWLEVDDDGVRQWSVEGCDPGVAVISGWFPRAGASITVTSNHGDDVRPLYRAIERALGV